MLLDAKETLEAHSKGEKILADDELIKLEKKINIYQRKLETMQGDLDEREVERIIKRDQLRNERLKERREKRRERQQEL